MIIRKQDFLAMPIISMREGEKIGDVKGFLVDRKKKEIDCLVAQVLCQGKTETGFIPLEDIVSIGDYAVMVVGKNSFQPADRQRQHFDEAQKSNILDIMAITPKGNRLGIVSGFELAEGTRKVSRILISPGGQDEEQAVEIEEIVFGDEVAVLTGPIPQKGQSARGAFEKKRQGRVFRERQEMPGQREEAGYFQNGRPDCQEEKFPFAGQEPDRRRVSYPFRREPAAYEEQAGFFRREEFVHENVLNASREGLSACSRGTRSFCGENPAEPGCQAEPRFFREERPDRRESSRLFRGEGPAYEPEPRFFHGEAPAGEMEYQAFPDEAPGLDGEAGLFRGEEPAYPEYREDPVSFREERPERAEAFPSSFQREEASLNEEPRFLRREEPAYAPETPPPFREESPRRQDPSPRFGEEAYPAADRRSEVRPAQPESVWREEDHSPFRRPQPQAANEARRLRDDEMDLAFFNSEMAVFDESGAEAFPEMEMPGLKEDELGLGEFGFDAYGREIPDILLDASGEPDFSPEAHILEDTELPPPLPETESISFQTEGEGFSRQPEPENEIKDETFTAQQENAQPPQSFRREQIRRPRRILRQEKADEKPARSAREAFPERARENFPNPQEHFSKPQQEESLRSQETLSRPQEEFPPLRQEEFPQPQGNFSRMQENSVKTFSEEEGAEAFGEPEFKAAKPQMQMETFFEKQKKFLLGKTLAREILNYDGTVLIPSGTVITEQVFNTVKKADKENIVKLAMFSK